MGIHTNNIIHNMSFDFGINTIDNVSYLGLNIKNKKIIYAGRGREWDDMFPSRNKNFVPSRKFSREWDGPRWDGIF